MVTEATGRAIVNTRAGGRCELCGAPGTNIHHRRKRSQGGRWDPSNLLRLCGSGTTGCHGRIEVRPKVSHRLGLWLTSGDPAPAEAPVVAHPSGLWLGWWQPADDGTWVEVRELDAGDVFAYGVITTPADSAATDPQPWTP